MKIWNAINGVFDALPLAAVIDDKVNSFDFLLSLLSRYVTSLLNFGLLFSGVLLSRWYTSSMGLSSDIGDRQGTRAAEQTSRTELHSLGTAVE